MPGIITKHFRLHTAAQFQEQFGEDNPSSVYLFIGRTTEWNDDNNPPTPSDTVNSISYQTWNRISAMKKVNQSDASFAAPRYDWETGTVYDQYVADDVQDERYYVVNSEFKVYKCINNNGGAASTEMPNGRSLNTFTTADGYRWKYMGDIEASDALKYLTASYIPVKTLTADNGSYQWNVQESATNGSIETVTVYSGGAGYVSITGTVVTANATTVTLASGASATDGTYTGSTVYISSGTGVGQIRTITNYVGATRVATLDSSWTTVPTDTSQYVVSPKITITGDGTGFSAYPTITAGSVSRVNILTIGQDYSRATLAVSANSGSGCSLVAHVSPRGGHGADPVAELAAHNVMLNVRLTGAESNTFFTNNDFRIVGLVVDPLVANGSIADASSYNLLTTLTLTNQIGTFAADEVISGGTSEATANFVEYANSTAILVNGDVYPFIDGETITGANSTSTAIIDNVIPSSIQKYSGRIIYLENRPPIVRANEQTEDVKLIVRF